MASPKDSINYLLGQIDSNVNVLVKNQTVIMENQEDYEEDTKKRFEVLEREIKELQHSRMYIKGVWAVISALFGVIGGLLPKLF